jgi:hypothetical protein
LRDADQTGNNAAGLPSEDLLDGAAKISHPSICQ